MLLFNFSFGIILIGGSLAFITYLILSRKTKFELKFKYVYEKPQFPSNDVNISTDPCKPVKIQFAKSGIASYEESPPLTVIDVINKALNNKPNAPYLAKEYRNNPSNEYKWKYWTRVEILSLMQCVSRGFVSLGLEPFEAVCIMGFNCPEWFLADLAAIYAGGLAVGLYSTNNVGQCEYIINHCNAKIICVEDGKQLDKFLKIQNKQKLGNVKAIIVWNDDNAVEQYPKNDELKVITWKTLIDVYGKKDDKMDEVIHQRQQKMTAGHCCTLIYTSGTTGNPKGCMLSHDNMLWTIKAILSSQKHVAFWGKDSLAAHAIISYLPLSHIAAQCLDIYGPLMIAYNGGDGIIYFARNDALKGSLIKTLSFVQPTVFLGVPRVWEKIEEKMRLIGKKGNFLVKFISKNAKKIGLEGAYNKQLGGNGNIPLLYKLVNTLIFDTIKKKLGFSRLIWAISGAAPIKKSSMEYFHSLGIPLIEGYGMSESTAMVTIGVEYHNKIGCAGPPLVGLDVMIDADHQNEICVRGRNVMMGYIHDLDKTKSVFSNNGYLRTGDIGMIEEKTNLLFITGRIKELIITAGGENVSPVHIEDCIKTLLGGISNCVLIGDERKYLTLLVTLKTKNELSDILDGDAVEVDEKCKSIGDAKQSEKWKKYIENGIGVYNKDAQMCVSRAQRIQYFRILDKEFSEQSGEVTSTLKLKRSVIAKKYADIIDSMYK